MNERNENNSSKTRTYLLFVISLLLMGVGLFGGFYTLMWGINTNKLAGKIECVKSTFVLPIYRCPKGGKFEENSLMCTDWYEETNINKSCKSGYSDGGIKYSFNYGIKTRQCNKKYPASISCPSGYSLLKNTSNTYSCSKCTSYKTSYPISCSSNRVAGKQFECTVDGGDFRKGNAYILTGNCTKTNLTLNKIGVTCQGETYVQIKYEQGDDTGTSNSYYVKAAPTTKVKQATTRPYAASTTTAKPTTTKTKLKNISLKCKTKDGKTLKDGSTITVYRPVTCTVDTTGVKFKATGKSAVTLTGNKKEYSFSYIKSKESATIKVSKSGYKTKTIKFKLTDDMKITSNSKKAFKVYCPSRVRVGDKFVCYVSEEYRGAVITTTFGTGKPVEVKKNTKILYLKYDKPGTLVVSAKYGKAHYNKTVKIVDSETAKKTKVHFNCSRTEVNRNEKFYCFSRIHGVQIKVDEKCKLNSGFNSTTTTSFDNNTRKYLNYFSCSKGDNTEVTITAKKEGYLPATKTIRIK